MYKRQLNSFHDNISAPPPVGGVVLGQAGLQQLQQAGMFTQSG